MRTQGQRYTRRDVLVGAGVARAALASTPTASATSQSPARAGRRSDIKLLVFDTFGTVVDWRGTIIAEGQALSRAKGVQVDWAACADAWLAEYRPSMDRVRKGEIPWTNLDRLHRMSLDRLLPKFKLTLTEAETQHLNRVWHRWKPWPDSVPGLTRLRTAHARAALQREHLCMGAAGVCIGRPYIWGLGAFGQPGVERVLELLRIELYAAMQQVGAPSIKHLVPGMVRRA